MVLFSTYLAIGKPLAGDWKDLLKLFVVGMFPHRAVDSGRPAAVLDAPVPQVFRAQTDALTLHEPADSLTEQCAACLQL